MEEIDLKLKNQEDKFELMFEQNSKDHLGIQKSLSDLSRKLDEMVDKMDKKYAPMYVRDLVVWGGGICGSMLIIYALERIIMK